ncbi:MAG: V0D/AC39 family V-type ATPase subunit [Candidatus Methanodesulfokora sp.]
MSKERYLVVRTHGLMTHLLNPDRIRSWAMIPDWESLFKEISSTEYGVFLEKVDDLRSADKVTDVTLRVLGRRVRTFLEISKGDVVEEATVRYLAKYDVENLKRKIFSLLIRKEGVSEERFLPISGFMVSMDPILRASDVSQICDLLPQGKLRDFISAWLSSGQMNIPLLDIGIDRAYLAETIAWAERTKMREVFRIYAENYALGVILRSQLTGIGSEFYSPMLEFLSQNVRKALSESNTFEESIKALLSTEAHKSMASELMGVYEKYGVPWTLDLSLFKELYSKIRSLARMKPLSSIFPFSYIVAAEWESWAVRTVVLGKLSGIESEKIYDMLSLY